MSKASSHWRLTSVLVGLMFAGTVAIAMAQPGGRDSGALLQLYAGSQLDSPRDINLAAPPTSPIYCNRVSSVMAIDGRLGDWPPASGLSLDQTSAQYVGGAPSGASDISANLRCVWDDQNLYLSADVSDAVLIADSSTIWDDDSVEIALDGDRDRSCCAAYDHQATIAVDGRLADFSVVESIPGVRAAAAVRTGGFVVEASFPFTWFLPGPAAQGTFIGFDWGLNDDDDGGRRDKHLLWAGSSILNYPAFGDLLLGGPFVPGSTPTVPATPTATPQTPATATRTATTPPTATATSPAGSTSTPTTAASATRTPTSLAATATRTATPTGSAATSTRTPTQSTSPVSPTATATPTQPASPVSPTATPTTSGTPAADRVTALETNMNRLSSLVSWLWGIMQTAGYLPGNTPPMGTPLPTATPTSVVSAYVQRVRAGGADYTDTKGKLWSADQPYSAGSWGYVGGRPFTTTMPISGTQDAPLYQSERYSMTSYQFDVPPGLYEVELRFAEIYQFAVPNQRIFDVQLESSTVITGLDLTASVGTYVAYDRTFQVAVADGQLTIDFITRKGASKISAIRVSGITPLGPTPTPSLDQRVGSLENTMTSLETFFQQILATFDRFLGVP